MAASNRTVDSLFKALMDWAEAEGIEQGALDRLITKLQSVDGSDSFRATMVKLRQRAS